MDASVLRNVLTPNGYWMLNKKLYREFGFAPAIIIPRLVDLDIYFKTKFEDSSKEYDGWFYQTSIQLQDELNIGKKAQRAAIKLLEEKGIISTRVVGIPATKYFFIHYDKINNYLTDPQSGIITQTTLGKTPKQASVNVPRIEKSYKRSLKRELVPNNSEPAVPHHSETISKKADRLRSSIV